MAYTHATSINKFGVTPLIVATNPANGSHTTLAGAIADAVSGETIVLRDSVTENVTLPAGINIAGWNGSSLNVPTIIGTITCTDAGTRTISGIRLQTNSAAFLAVTGSAASIVNLNNCYLNASNNNGITFSSSSASAAININNCLGDLGSNTTFFAHSSAGVLYINRSLCANSGLSTTASTCSAGNLICVTSVIAFPITTSSTGIITAFSTSFNTNSINTTSLTSNGTLSTITHSDFSSGSASSISVGGTLNLFLCGINSTNTNAIAGAGTLNYAGLIFTGTSYKISTTTQGGGTIQGGRTQAPSAGFLGEIIEGTATSVAVTSNIAKTITSIALTPGIWDISALAFTLPTGGTGLAQALLVDISTTTDTIEGSAGIQYSQINISSTALSSSVPQFRVTLTANTTYYLVCNVIYTSTTSPTNGRLSATRVG